MHRFYVENPNLTDGLALKITQNDSILNHIHVLRLKINDKVELFNGNGNIYLAMVREVSRKYAILEIELLAVADDGDDLKPKINLICGLISNDKFDLVLQKATELGVNQITPLISNYSQRIPPNRIDQRIIHWQKIIISACEQSKRRLIPTINPITEFDSLCDCIKTQPAKIKANTSHSNILSLICEPNPIKSHKLSRLNQFNTNSELVQDSTRLECINIAIGSEGGFSDEELDIAHESGFIPLQMGTLVLRAETASIAAISYVKTKLNLWK